MSFSPRRLLTGLRDLAEGLRERFGNHEEPEAPRDADGYHLTINDRFYEHGVLQPSRSDDRPCFLARFGGHHSPTNIENVTNVIRAAFADAGLATESLDHNRDIDLGGPDVTVYAHFPVGTRIGEIVERATAVVQKLEMGRCG